MHFEAREIKRRRHRGHRAADGGEARTRNEERRRGKPKPQGQKRAAAYKTGYRHGDDGALPQKARGAVGRKPKAEQSCCRERDGDVAGEHEDRVELREERAVHEGGGAERQKQRDEPAQGARLFCSAFRFHVTPFRSLSLLRASLHSTRENPLSARDRGFALITAGRWRGGATGGIPWEGLDELPSRDVE